LYLVWQDEVVCWAMQFSARTIVGKQGKGIS